ncbi:MAG: ATP-binding protein [Oscillospiraceae bacterium]|nr:ATP-binding protein [Oscillospiraceae bacterium]
MNLKELEAELGTLTVFGGVNADEVFSEFRFMLFMLERKQASRFAWQLYRHMTDDWTAYLRDLIFTMETPCTYFASVGKPIPVCIEQAARHDLNVLSVAAGVTTELVSFCMNAAEGEYIPSWKAEPIDLESLYFERLAEIGRHGFGVFAKYRMFHMELSEKQENGYILEPALYPDKTVLHDLIGYELQRSQIIENTKALLAGKKAANILLYGDAGTGKSATVKAVANEFADEGLRLIELSKDELHLMPKLLDKLGANPLKFILFIDDLSFQENDDNFSALKAVLEGSISARTQNTVIYATSNRRHIVRETFSQRAGDEIHRNDTMQETISLSERFGIKVYFEKPNKALYLEIVSALAVQYGLEMDAEALALEAERFAMRKSGRSARAARQLIEQMIAKQALNCSQNCDNEE